MRERTTWNREDVLKRTAAMGKKADPYTMNQDHKQPSADDYVSGDSSSWAEDVAPSDWDKETKRDEIGLPEKLDKTAATALLLKKADLCVKVAQMVLRNASDDAVEDQALAFMSLPDADLINTFNRLAQDEQAPAEQQAEESKQAEQQEQAPAAQEPAAQAAQEQQMTAMQQAMQAMQQGDEQGAKAAIQQMVTEAMQQAKAQQQAPAQQAPAQVQASKKKAQDEQQEQAPAEEQKQAAPQAPVAGQDLQAMVQQAVQSALAGMGLQQQAQQEQAPMQAQADEMLLDDMLADPTAPMGDMGGDIELEPSPMDVGEMGLGPEDEALKMLFANDDEQEQAQAQAPAQDQKQASVLRTASTRTVGTKPTAGVSRVGGSVSQSKTASSDVDKLSNIWSSAPDVRDHFGMK